jgi:hypothetical protein
MDDPLFLLMQGIWLLAAGMYPLGFLFGACSACCDECPEECNKCVHSRKGGDAEPAFGCFAKMNSVTITTAYGTFTCNNYYPSVLFSDSNCGAVPLQVGVDENNDPVLMTFTTLGPLSISDSCGCADIFCIYRVGGEVNGSPVDIGSFVSGVGPSATLVKNPNANIPYLLLGDCADPGDVLLTDDVTDRIVELVGNGGSIDGNVSVEIEVDPCECGACCLDGDCTENISEFECEDPFDFLGTPKGVWQGVGTDCDPNPCEEE